MNCRYLAVISRGFPPGKFRCHSDNYLQCDLPYCSLPSRGIHVDWAKLSRSDACSVFKQPISVWFKIEYFEVLAPESSLCPFVTTLK
jgi:hypothetical protein